MAENLTMNVEAIRKWWVRPLILAGVCLGRVGVLRGKAVDWLGEWIGKHGFRFKVTP